MKKCKHNWEIISETTMEVPLDKPKTMGFKMIQVKGIFGWGEEEIHEHKITTEDIPALKVICRKCWKVKTIKEGELP